MAELAEDIKINKKTISALAHDMVKSAKAADLIYALDSKSGFSRKQKGKLVYFFDGSKKVKDKIIIERIKKLGIPPAWKNVWICKIANGHLQATGFDLLQRKQYKYHSLWNTIRKQTKFYRLNEFGVLIPVIRKQIEKDLFLTGFPKEKILAAVVSLLERTNIRVGNAFYEKLYGSFGLTTMQNRHIVVNGTQLRFSFKGKKGVHHNITLKSKILSRIVKECKDIPGKELFEFYDDNGNIHSIDSGMVNNYISTITGGEFTAKDFRTWAGTVSALAAFNELGSFETATEMNQKIHSAFEKTAKQLGNTVTVCKNYYVHPVIVDLYKENKLEKYLNEIEVIETADGQKELMPIEKVLLKILNNS
jgi:DNA topoisomerase-1